MCHGYLISVQTEKKIKLYHHSTQTLGINMLTENGRIAVIWKDNKTVCRKTLSGLHLLQPLN